MYLGKTYDQIKQYYLKTILLTQIYIVIAEFHWDKYLKGLF